MNGALLFSCSLPTPLRSLLRRLFYCPFRWVTSLDTATLEHYRFLHSYWHMLVLLVPYYTLVRILNHFSRTKTCFSVCPWSEVVKRGWRLCSRRVNNSFTCWSICRREESCGTFGTNWQLRQDLDVPNTVINSCLKILVIQALGIVHCQTFPIEIVSLRWSCYWFLKLYSTLA